MKQTCLLQLKDVPDFLRCSPAARRSIPKAKPAIPKMWLLAIICLALPAFRAISRLSKSSFSGDIAWPCCSGKSAAKDLLTGISSKGFFFCLHMCHFGFLFERYHVFACVSVDLNLGFLFVVLEVPAPLGSVLGFLFPRFNFLSQQNIFTRLTLRE